MEKSPSNKGGGPPAQPNPMHSSMINDLSSRAGVFKSKLIDEFILVDSGGATDTSAYSVEDLIAGPDIFNRIILETPNQLIKLSNIRRKGVNVVADKRLLRISTRNRAVPGVWANWLIYSTHWQRMITLLIIIDAVLIGAQVELNQETHYAILSAAHTIDSLILLVFGLEILLKWVDSFVDFWNNGWNVFDFVITALSAAPELIALAGNTSASGISTVARQLRVFRMFRFLKTIARFPALRIIVAAILKTFKAIAAILQLLAIFMFIYAVFGMQLFTSYSSSDRTDLFYKGRFDNLGITLMTLFQLLTYDHWVVMIIDIRQVVNPTVVTIYVMSWVFISAIVFRNIFIGVMVNNFGEISRKVRKREKKKKKKRQMDMIRRRLYRELNAKKEREGVNVKDNTALADDALVNSNATKINFLSNLLRVKKLPPNFATLKAKLAVEQILALTKPQQVSSSNNAPGMSKDGLPENMHGPMHGNNAQHTQPHPATLQESFAIIQSYLAQRSDASQGVFRYDKAMERLLDTLANSKTETLWHRDTLFKYLLAMEQLQENMKKYQELLNLATLALSEIHDS
eukprot:TRINITY_DN3389_c0_g1_i2.p1 TRINITY_DN3389_c0_g1~~TRINITY_DN3389_c0_g1_i2.p1  ORF type:complete len:573 (+),score=116.85 TRINITY_DN3389_c0_g1_i2:221-1939(+)